MTEGLADIKKNLLTYSCEARLWREERLACRKLPRFVPLHRCRCSRNMYHEIQAKGTPLHAKTSTARNWLGPAARVLAVPWRQQTTAAGHPCIRCRTRFFRAS